MPAGEARRVEAEGLPPLAVYQVGGRFFVTDDRCTHGEASLADGLLEDSTIICPFHFGSFDIATGRPLAAPCVKPLRVYPAFVSDEAVWITIDAQVSV